jgi:hypothetical protein
MEYNPVEYKWKGILMGKVFSANDYAPHDGILRVHCVHHEGGYIKSDAFIIEFDGQIWLIDGGMPDSLTAQNYLLSIRDRWLAAVKVPAGESAACKLKLNWIISHFHVDHVAATIESIIPDPAFELDTFYLPPDSALDPVYNTYGVDGDTKYRPRLAEALKKYGTGNEKIVNIEFGKENILRFTDVSGQLHFTIYPTPYDGGTGERLDYMVSNYYKGNYESGKIATAVVNSCCPWVHLAYGEKTFLFTGDLMKREEYLNSEAADEMLRTYRDSISEVNVVKYLHHGVKRDAAAAIVMSFKPEYIIVSSAKETASVALKKANPCMTAKILNCALRDIIFSTDGNSLTVSESELLEEDKSNAEHDV